MVHRVTVGWCHGGCCGGRMYCPKAGYLEKIKAITSRLLGSRRERKIVSCSKGGLQWGFGFLC